MLPTRKRYYKKGKPIRSGKGCTGPRVTEAKEGGSIKRGCRCRFHVKKYYFLPHIGEITYNETEHVNSLGMVTHDKDNIGQKTRFRKHISNEIRDFVRNLYLAGVPVSQIHSLHCAAILKARDEGNLVPSRDCFLSEDDIRNMAGILQKDVYMKNPNDAESVRMWVKENPNLVFYYQETGQKVPGSLLADNMPFVDGIQTAYQYDQMLKHGHSNAVAIDATFGTNDKKVRCNPLLSIVLNFGSRQGLGI